MSAFSPIPSGAPAPDGAQRSVGDAEVYAVYSQGEMINVTPNTQVAWSDLTFDVIVHEATGDVIWNQVRSAWPGPSNYDVNPPMPGTPVGVTSRGQQIMFWIPWLPAITDCSDQSGGSGGGGPFAPPTRGPGVGP